MSLILDFERLWLKTNTAGCLQVECESTAGLQAASLWGEVDARENGTQGDKVPSGNASHGHHGEYAED